jgi:crossover junction endodeoxyribonuclease RuvC
MKILGIDPGYDRLGLAVIEGTSSKPVYIWSECFEPPKGLPKDRLSSVYGAVAKAIKKHTPDRIAVEALYFSANKKTALSVAQARGAILAACGAHAIPVLECTPNQVKVAVTGYGSADKKAIANMIPKLITLPEKIRMDDELDALAISICGLSYINL